MYCSKCKSVVSQGLFCEICGTPLSIKTEFHKAVSRANRTAELLKRTSQFIEPLNEEELIFVSNILNLASERRNPC